jgi:hypothetical protein
LFVSLTLAEVETLAEGAAPVGVGSVWAYDQTHVRQLAATTVDNGRARMILPHRAGHLGHAATMESDPPCDVDDHDLTSGGA